MGLGGYYFYVLSTAKNIPSPTPNNLGISDWVNIKTQVLANCKQIPPFSDGAAANSYVIKLGGGGISFDNAKQEFVSTGNVPYEVSKIGPNGELNPQNLTGPACIFVWIGDLKGGGNIFYESIYGSVLKLPVTDFPLPLRYQPTP